MSRFVSLIAAAALAAGPAFAQGVSSEAPPEDAAPPTAEALAAPLETPAPAEAAPAEAVAEAPASAPEVAADPNVYQVLRAGDRNMSCEALIAETNSLNAYILAEQQKAQKKKGGSKVARAAGGAATSTGLKAAGRFGLSRMAGSFGPLGAVAALAATDALADGAGAAVAQGGDSAPAQPQVMPEQQRMNHLLGIYREKGC